MVEDAPAWATQRDTGVPRAAARWELPLLSAHKEGALSQET